MPTHQERVVQTEKAIMSALVAVGKTKSLNQITISDLTRHSGISRGTFYLHYLDKDDLVTKMEAALTTEFQRLLDGGIEGTMNPQDFTAGRPYPVIDQIVALVTANRALLAFLFGPNGDPGFVALLTDKLQTAILGELYRVKGTPTFRRDLPQPYALSLVTNAIMAVVRTWLAGEDSLPPAELAQVIMRALYFSPYDMLGITGRDDVSDENHHN